MTLTFNNTRKDMTFHDNEDVVAQAVIYKKKKIGYEIIMRTCWLWPK